MAAGTFLGGEMKLDTGAARNAMEKKIAEPLGLDVIKAAEGIFRIVNNNMSNGIRVVSVQRGYDPRDFVLVAFGGNGAIHAGVQARELGICKVIVPRLATAFSARGLLNSNIVINKMRTYIARSDDYDLATVNSLLASMREEANRDLPTSGNLGEILQDYQIDMHYKGETHEITVPLNSSNGAVVEHDISRAVEAFHSAHEGLHTFSNLGDPVFFMNLRLETVVQIPKPPARALELEGEDAATALRTHRSVYFGEMGGFVETPIYDGTRIRCGNIMEGPCVIEEPATTIVVYLGQRARLTEMDNYEILME